MKLFRLSLIIGLSLFTLQGAYAATGSTMFSDVPPSHEYAVAINALKSKGAITGYANNTFEPDLYINRAEALKIIMETAAGNIPEVTVSKFPDVQASDWFAKYANAAKDKNIIGGYPDGTFRGSTLVNYAEILKISLRAFDIYPESMYTEAQLKVAFPKYKGNEWFLPYIMYAKEKNLPLLSEPALYPTRGQMAELLFRLRSIRTLGLGYFNTTYNKEYVLIEDAVSSMPFDIEKAKFSLIDTSPLLSGGNPTLSRPLVLIFSPLEKRELLLEITNGLLAECDLIQTSWNKAPYISEDKKAFLTGLLISIKNDLSSTKNELINMNSNNADKDRELILRIERLRKDVVKMYANTFVGYVENIQSRRSVLESLSKLSSQDEYQKIIALFDSIKQSGVSMSDLTATITDKRDPYLILREIFDTSNNITNNLTTISQHLSALAQRVSVK